MILSLMILSFDFLSPPGPSNIASRNNASDSTEIADTLGTIVPIPTEGTAREFIAVPAEDRPGIAEQAKEKTVGQPSSRKPMQDRHIR